MGSSSILEFATTAEIEIDASCQEVWHKIHDVENFSSTFRGVYIASVIGDPCKVGSRRRITRLTRGHCFSAVWSLVRYDEDSRPFPRTCKFYSEDFVGSNRAVASTTWTVTPTDDSNRCLVTISLAISPRNYFLVIGRLVFAPFMKKLARKSVEEDLEDLAAACTINSKFAKSEKTESTAILNEDDIILMQ